MGGNNILKGVLLVGLGATSYGCLATIVKLAYHDTGITGKPFTPAEVISSQFILGILAVWTIMCFQSRRKPSLPVGRRDVSRLMLVGTSTGLTSIFYYMAVKFIPVSIGIVLLMQTVWMGVLLEWILEKRPPSGRKILAVLLVLFGTALATKLFDSTQELDWRGLVLGLMAAASFTTTMFAANRVATGTSAVKRSFYMLLGGGVMVLIFALATQNQAFNYDIFYKWGILLALFGTIIPPLLLNAGFPHTGIGLGSIVSALELPVSVFAAYMLLNEPVGGLQWTGIGIILGAIVMMNLSKRN